MTKAQEWIVKYVNTQFVKGSVQMRPVGAGVVEVTDRTGEKLVFTVNAFGDIMDNATKKIVAESDIPHDLDILQRNPMQEPTTWTSLPW